MGNQYLKQGNKLRRKIINFHRTDCNNIGDIICSPLLYYNFPSETEEVDIMQITGQKWLENADIIVGGGGLISCDFFERRMKFIAENKKSKAILWGAGHNDWQISDSKFTYPDYIKKFDLIGLRDYNQDLDYEYVPCVSCKSHWFDIKYEVKFEFAIFGHGAPIRVKEILEVASKFDNPQFAFITNKGTDDAAFGKVIRVLGEAEVILTNSYHGMYWGILLEKKVLVFPSSSKFYSLKYGAEICDASNWKLKLNQAKTYPEALEECRFLNDKFYEKSLEVTCT